MKQKLYFLEYDDGCDRCPVFTGGKFLRDNLWTGDHEWSFDDPEPHKYGIYSSYSLKINEKFIDFDYSGHGYVSDKFLKTLDECNVKYRAIPLKIILRGNRRPQKNYFFLLLVGRFFILDKQKSNYTISKNPNNYNDYLYEPYFPSEVCYDFIEEFYIKDNCSFPDFFICGELKKEICTERFKDLCESLGNVGIKFTEIIDGFKYDPWED